MKRLLTILAALALVLLCAVLLPTEARAATSGYYTYSVSNGEATITDCNTSISGAITIPSELGGYPVTGIGGYAFNSCGNLTRVIIPDSVTSIGNYAFYSCGSLNSVTIGNNVASIGNYAFRGCSDLTSVTIPNSVTSIGNSAFADCDLYSVTIGSGVTSIGDYAFYSCNNLTRITIPDSVTDIGAGAFYYCRNLASIAIGKNVTSIGNDAFYYCDNLTSITIPDSVTSIGNYAFYSCYSLNSVTIGKGVTSIGNDAFRGCTSLISVTIPNSVTSIGDSAFSDCDLYSVTIGSGVTSIGNYAFYSCDNLTRITIPNSVTDIGAGAFYYCRNLASIAIGKNVTSIGNSAFYYCSSLSSVNIPDSVTSIGQSAFYYCSNLTNVTIPDGVTSIGNSAFYYCSSLTSVNIPDSVTSIGNSAFYGCSSIETVIVRSKTCSFGSSCGFGSDHTIYGFPGSTAEFFSERVGAEFVAMNFGITKQPASVAVANGATATTTVGAKGDGLTYQWYYTAGGSSNTFKKSSITSATYFATMDVSKAGRKVYCVITDKYGNKATTNTVTLNINATITNQPTSVTVANGKTAAVTVTAKGESLKYQWYYTSNGNSSTFMKSSITSATYFTTMDAAKAGRRAYCIITDAYGNTATTNTVTLRMKASITKQPTSVTVVNGATAKTSVTAVGEGLKYQWYFTSNGNTSTFMKSSTTTPVYSTTMDASRAGRQVYCVITDQYGNSVRTNTVTLKMQLRITKQPASTVVSNGATVKTTVTAQGEGLKYQWYYTANGSSNTFMKSSYTTATYSTTMDGSKVGRRVCCVITDRYGNTMTTNAVTLGMNVVITKQPASVTVAKGKTAAVTVTAKGEGLKYQWYYTAGGNSSTFTKSSITSATYFTTMDAAKSGRRVYCVITDKYGNTVKTSTATLRMS